MVCSAADIVGVDVVVQGTGRRGARCAQAGGLWSIETCEQMLTRSSMQNKNMHIIQ